MNFYTLKDIKVGTSESFQVQVTKEMHDSFTASTGDINPMHIDKEWANDHGFNDVLVYGMLTASFYSTLVGVYLPGKHCLFQECKVGFNHPVFIGDILTITGTVTEINDVFGRVTVKATIRNQNNLKVSSAKLSIGILS